MSFSPDQRFLNLYQEHHSWIYSWLYRKLGNSADAADLAQDTFVRVISRQSQVELEQPRAYLTKVAKGLMINWIQHKSVERAYLEVLSEQPELLQSSPERDLLIVEALTEVIRLLSQLPDDVRSTFLYSQLDGLKHQQIADQLNISISTVKRHIQRAYAHCLVVMLDSDDV